MKISIKHIVVAALLPAGAMQAQTLQPHLKSYSAGLRAVHLYDLPSYRYDSEMNKDMKGLNGKHTSFDLGFDFYVEKQFTPIWGLQVGIRKGGLSGSNKVEYYTNHFTEGYGDLIVNLSNLDKKHTESRWGYYAKLGLGYGSFTANRFLITDQSANGQVNDNYWEGRLGAGLQYELNSYLRLELDMAYNVVFNDGFDGYNYSTGSDPYLSTGIGVAYTFGKKEEKPLYAVNFFSSEYFGTPVANNASDTREDSLMAAQLAAANSRLQAMDQLIAEQKAAIAKLEEQKGSRQNQKTQARELVFFDFDSAVLTEDAKRELSKNLDGTEENITLTGYADNTGDTEYNARLKARRAEAVKQFLVEVIGYNESAITIQLANEIKDLSKNDFLNRKVVLTYLH